MLCRIIDKSRYWIFLIGVGLVSFLFGILSRRNLTEEMHDLNMLMGMFTGLGAAFVVVGTFRLLHRKLTPPEKLKREHNERYDERSIQILRIAYTFASVASSVLFAGMAFLFVYLGYRVPAMVCLAALYLQVFVFFLAYSYYNRKM